VIVALLALALAAPVAVRPLSAGMPVRGSLAGGEAALFSIAVPADQAARIVVRQEGVDVTLTVRPAGAELIHGLDMRAGTDGEEVAFVPIASSAVTWNVRVSASLARARRGDYELVVDFAAADDAARTRAAAHARYLRASDTSWLGDADSYRRAQEEYAGASAAATAAGEPALAAEAAYQCARNHDVVGDYPGAIEWQRRALEMFRALGRRDRESRVLNRLGDLSRKVGEVADSERLFREALPLAREVDDPVTTADILNNSGLLMLFLGRDEEAIEQLQSAIPLSQEVNSANVEGALTLNIGDAYAHLGLYERAIDFYQRAYDIYVARLKLPRRSGRAQAALAEVQFASGNRGAADAAIARALELYEKSGDRSELAETQALKGRMLHADGNTDEAIRLFELALPVVHEAGNRLAEARILSTWAAIDVDRDQPAAALLKADQALHLAREIASPATEQNASFVRALALRRQHRLDEAVAAIAEVTSDVEAARRSMQRSELRTSYLAAVRRYFDLYIDLLQENGQPAAAFEISERARARTLLDGLAASAAKVRKGVDPALLARQRAVQDQLNAKENYRAQVALRDGGISGRATTLSRDVGRLLEEWNEIRAKIRRSSPAYAQLQAPEPTTVERVQRTLLDAASVLVEYHLGATASYVWVIDRTSIDVRRLPAADAIGDVARAYHALLSKDIASLTAAGRQQRSRRLATLGRRLAAQVWTPIEPLVASRRLLIVADGVLQYVPFAALPRSNGEPLIVRNEVVYLPSASVLESIREHSRPIQPHPTAAVFADPVFSKSDPRLTGRRDSSAPAQTRAADGELYGRLRFSREEAEAINARVPSAFAALDFMAAKQTLLGRDLRKYRVLHFATHGSLNASRPDLSGLVLSLVDANGQPADGFLRLHEIYNLDLDADLVVLSACRTALGRDVYGEGLIGLTRGFMYAGAPRVVSTVWNVDDRASAQLMARFYEAMFGAPHRPPASALRDAQLALLRQARWADPHYWAAFGLQGDWK
jgi:CHAT domain-containing protein